MRWILLIAVAHILNACATAASAQEVDESEAAKDTILKRLSATYNGEVLLSAQTISLYEDVRLPYDSHDYGAEFHDLSLQRRQSVIDFDRKRMSTDYLTQIGSINFDGREIIQDGREIFIDYGHDMYQDMGEIDFDQSVSGTVRGSEVLLAREVLKAPELTTVRGETVWHGYKHDILELARGDRPSLSLYVNQQTGVISYMRRIVGDLTVHYTYDRPIRKNELTYAREFSVFANDELLNISFGRRVALNPSGGESAFEIGSGIVEEPTRIDQSVMTVEEVRTGVFQVGQGTAYSTFFATDDGVLAFGVEEGFAERLAAFREETGNKRDLSFVVVPNHHASEIAGAGDALSAGATLLVTAGARPLLLERFASDYSGDRFVAIDGDMELSGVLILSLQTAHAAEVLVIFDPSTDVLTQAYHYVSPYIDEPFYAKHGAVTLHAALAERNVAPEYLLSDGGRKLIHWAEFEDAVERYDSTPCHRQRAVCEDL